MAQMTKIKKVCIMTGSRADYGILSNLLKDLQNSKYFSLKLIVSCMHLIPNYGNTYKEIIKDKVKIYKKIKLPIKGDNVLHISKATGYGIEKFTRELVKIRPDFVVILGDRFEALSFAVSAMFLKIPNIHGGESTYALIDDSIRHSITKMANIHFVSNKFYGRRLISMGENPKNIFVTGSLALDNLKKTKFFTRSHIEKTLKFKLGDKNIIFTIHPETIGNNNLSKYLNGILNSLKKLKNTKIIFTMSNIDMGNKVIHQTIKNFVEKNKSTSIIVKSLGQQLYFSILKFTDLVIGNSSSGIIEVPSFKIPTINIGNRQSGRLKPKSVIDFDLKKDNFEKKLYKSLSKKFRKNIKKIKNPYFKKDTAKKMTSIMKKIDFSKGTQKVFYEKKN